LAQSLKFAQIENEEMASSRQRKGARKYEWKKWVDRDAGNERFNRRTFWSADWFLKAASMPLPF